MGKRLSDLYKLNIHGNDYHEQDYVTDIYLENELYQLTWQNKVIDFYDPSTSLPNAPSVRDRYIASASANGWINNYIYEWNGGLWVEYNPKNSSTLFVENENRNYIYLNSQWVVIEEVITHNDLSSIQGSAEGYHLQQTAHNKLKNQDQEVYSTSSSTFDDLSITNPVNIYASLNHDDFNDYDAQDHRQWENSIAQNIHDDNITSSSITQHESDITHNNIDSIQGSAEGYHLQFSAYDNLKNQDQEVYSISLPNFNQITLDSSPTEANEVARKDYVDSAVDQSIIWRDNVIDFYDFSTGTPSASGGDRYISTTTTSASGFIENYIYEYSETNDWIEYEPENRWALTVIEEDAQFRYEEFYDRWTEISIFGYINHNDLSGIQGGSATEIYHLQQTAYNNLKNQDQEVYSTSSSTFDDLSITNPINIYASLNHDDFNDYQNNEHIDWTITGAQIIHDDRISQSSITQHEVFIDHDSLTNFEPNEHIDWTISGTENIHIDRIKDTVDDNIYGLVRYQNTAPLSADEVLWANSIDDTLYIYDAEAGLWVSLGIKENEEFDHISTNTLSISASGLFYSGDVDPTGSTRVNYDGYFYATKVYNAVYNDLVDFLELIENESIKYGHVYFQTGNGVKLTNKRCQKGVVGIASDTYGFALGYKKNSNQVPIGISGWVLSKTDKEYPIGTPLTNNKNGELTKMRWYEKILYPERMLAIMGRKEINNIWNDNIKVNNRYWVKIKG